MDAKADAITGSANLDLVLTRIFDAPPQVVFRAWTDPKLLIHWWGPRGFTLPDCTIDLRAGGSYCFHMRGSAGDDHWTRGSFREIVAPERIVFTGGWTDADGKPTSPVMVTTVTFEEQMGKTKLTLHQTGLESVAARDGHRAGWTGSFERLAEYLAAA